MTCTPFTQAEAIFALSVPLVCLAMSFIRDIVETFVEADRIAEMPNAKALTDLTERT